MSFRNLLPAILWGVLILIICGIPGNNIPKLPFWQWLKPDKVVHLVAFGVLSYLLLKAFRTSPRTNGRVGSHQLAVDNATKRPQVWYYKHAALSALMISISYGAIIEVLQETVFIRRTGDLRDVIANAMGAFVGWYVYRLRTKKLDGGIS